LKSHFSPILALFFLFSWSTTIFCQKSTNINWPEFIGRHDLVFEQLPLQWNEGAFVGNGQVGMMMFATIKDNRIDFHIGRQDVTDHRKAPARKTSMGVPGASVLFDFPRLDIGRMALRPAGKILSGSLRQDLWNAEIRGTIVTDLGTITLRAYTPYNRMVNVIELTSTEIADGKPAYYKWEFRPGNPATPRIQVFPWSDKNYITNPKPVLSQDKGLHSCVQTLLAGGDYATVWYEKQTGKASTTLFISTANEVPTVNKSLEVAQKTILDASKLSSSKLLKPHRGWWHAFYQKSFLSIPEGQMESFYWIQMYKMASCSRPDGPALDLFGPYFRVSQWPGLWWNLNIQLTYWNVLQSNHLELGENLITLIDEQFEALLTKFDNPKLGDFTWTMHNYWLQLRYGGNWKVLNEKWLPKAIEVAKLYEKHLVRNEKGQLEMTEMESPEYEGFKTYKNSSYNLALYRWLLTAMIECAEKNNSTQPEIGQWKNSLNTLIPLPTNENGVMIGSEQGLDKSHRHYSHLLGLYPLFVLNPDNDNDRKLVDKSVVHWHQIGGGKELAGYSYTGAASLYAALGRGNDAEAIMRHFLNGNIGISLLLSNTFYVEAGGKNPVIETPLSAANAISEMLLQSWGGKIRIFPAMPDKWQEASFDKLRTQGAFLVSAVRKNGQTQWVKIKSLAGEPCIVKIPGWTNAFQKSKGRKISITALQNNEFTLDLKISEEIILLPESNSKIDPVTPITLPADKYNFYGVKKGKELKWDQNWQLPEYTL
jgi:alpha-L-fucosidase 2